MKFDIRVVLIGATVYGLVWTACDKPKSPDRPSVVPAAATWVGGEDGGAWIECNVQSDGGANHCIVYSDSTGIVLANGLYRLRGQGKAAIESDLKYEYFDGHVIKLRRGGVLELITASKD